MAEGKRVGEGVVATLEDGRVLEPGVAVVIEDFGDGLIASSSEFNINGVGLTDEQALANVRHELSLLEQEIKTFPEDSKGPWVKKVEADLNSRSK